jgi:hypothetical protein
MRKTAAAAVLLFSRLLVGGTLLACADVVVTAVRQPGLGLWPLQFFAPLLPATAIGTAILALPFAVARARLEIAFRTAAPHPGRWVAIAIGLAAACSTAAWLVWARTADLPLPSAIAIGAGAAAALVAAALIARRVRPPRALLAFALAYGIAVTAWAFPLIAPDLLILPAAALWLAAALVDVEIPKAAVACAALLSAAGLAVAGHDAAGAARFHESSWFSAPLVGGVRLAIDFDRDGFSPILGGGDCDDLDALVYPGAMEIVGNGRDDNCEGGDLLTAALPAPDDAPSVVPPRRPDIVVLSLDAVRPDYVDRATTPTLSAFAAQSLYAPVAYTPGPYTGAGLVGLLTSTPVVDHHPENRFAGYETSLAEWLGRRGYLSVAVHCLADLSVNQVIGFSFVDNRLGPRCAHFATPTSDVMAELVLAHLAHRRAGVPYFLLAHFTDAHLPYIGGYREELRRLDRAVARVLAVLPRDAIVVVVSDHGEALGERGREGHIWRLDEELVRVLLMIRAPGVAARRIETPASLLDVAPTVADLLGADPAPGWQGRSLMRPAVPRSLVLETSYRNRVDIFGMRRDRYKITHDRRSGVFELYDLVTDPRGRDNLVGSRPEVFARMRRALGEEYDRLYNDRRVARKLRALSVSRPTMPEHVGPLDPL